MASFIDTSVSGLQDVSITSSSLDLDIVDRRFVFIRLSLKKHLSADADVKRQISCICMPITNLVMQLTYTFCRGFLKYLVVFRIFETSSLDFVLSLSFQSPSFNLLSIILLSHLSLFSGHVFIKI